MGRCLEIHGVERVPVTDTAKIVTNGKNEGGRIDNPTFQARRNNFRICGTPGGVFPLSAVCSQTSFAFKAAVRGLASPSLTHSSTSKTSIWTRRGLEKAGWTLSQVVTGEPYPF